MAFLLHKNSTFRKGTSHTTRSIEEEIHMRTSYAIKVWIFPEWLIACCFSNEAEINALSQYSHLNGFSTLWTLQRCLIRSRFFKNDSLHSWHLCGLSPRWTTFIWVLSKWRSLLSNSHSSHWDGSILRIGHVMPIFHWRLTLTICSLPDIEQDPLSGVFEYDSPIYIVRVFHNHSRCIWILCNRDVFDVLSNCTAYLSWRHIGYICKLVEDLCVMRSREHPARACPWKFHHKTYSFNRFE